MVGKLDDNWELCQHISIFRLRLPLTPHLTLTLAMPGQGEPPNSNLPHTFISTELSSLLTKKLRVVTKVYKMAAKDEIKEAIYALHPLRGKVENFFQFEEEVRETITSVFEKHRSGQDVFQNVCSSRIEVGSVIELEISMVLKSVYRRLTARMKAREPWTVTFTRNMPE